MTDALAGSWAKLGRAKEHADDLAAQFVEWSIDAQPEPPIRKRFDADDGCFVYFVIEAPDALVEWSLILGDALTNLRAAIDYLAWEIVKKGTEPEPERPNLVAFPVAHERNDFLGILPTKLPGVLPLHRTVIERYQPYQRPAGMRAQHPLARLSKMCGIEKHQRLAVTALLGNQYTAQIPAVFPDFTEVRREIRNPATLGPLVPGTELIRIYGHPTVAGVEPDVQVKWEGSLILTLPPNHLPVDVLLREAGAMIAGLLGEFDPLL